MFVLYWSLLFVNSTSCSEISRNFGPDFVHQQGLSCLGIGKQRHTFANCLFVKT